MRITYTPILHAKQGEFIALSHLSDAKRATMLPLFDIGEFTQRMHDIKRYQSTGAPVKAYLDWVAQEIHAAATGMPVMIDAFGWQPDATTEGGELPTAYTVRKLLKLGHRVVPIIGLDRWDDESYRESLANLPAEALSFCTIRIDADDTDDLNDIEERLASVLEEMNIDPCDTGILLDFGSVFGKDDEDIAARAIRFFNHFGADGYRFYSMAGCSMPASIDKAVKKHDSTGMLARVEMLAWQKVREARPLLPVIYGDYGVRGPTSIDKPVKHVNGKIRYTINGAFFIARGQSVKVENSVQMYRLAKIVKGSPHYMGRQYSWGDSELHARATYVPGTKPKVKPGWSNEWIRFDTSHHLTHVVTEVTATEQAIAAALATPLAMAEFA